MNPHLEDIEYPDGGTPAKVVLKSMLNDDDELLPIMGKNERQIVRSKDGYYTQTNSCSFPYYNSNHFLFMEDGIAKGFFAVKEDRLDFVRREISTIHLLYVDKKYQSEGIGKKIVEKIKHYAGKIDHLCKTRSTYLSRIVNERFFSVVVYPNLFD